MICSSYYCSKAYAVWICRWTWGKWSEQNVHTCTWVWVSTELGPEYELYLFSVCVQITDVFVGNTRDTLLDCADPDLCLAPVVVQFGKFLKIQEDTGYFMLEEWGLIRGKCEQVARSLHKYSMHRHFRKKQIHKDCALLSHPMEIHCKGAWFVLLACLQRSFCLSWWKLAAECQK